jgi:OOP family OmpA-OmpF porin
MRVSIEGHTDSIGTDAYNQKLSERRARTVRDHMVGQGIAADRITTRGFGESKPIASNETAEGRAQNRRVEIFAE